MKKAELLKLSPGELTDMGICPTCFNRENGGALYGDNSDKIIYEDDDIECFFVGNPRAPGHLCISSVTHYPEETFRKTPGVITVVYPEAGDDLFSIAERYHTTPAALAEGNRITVGEERDAADPALLDGISYLLVE